MTSDPTDGVTAGPAETSEGRNVVEMIGSDSPLPPQTGSQVDNCAKPPTTDIITCLKTHSRSWTRLESFLGAIKGSDSTLKEKKCLCGFVYVTTFLVKRHYMTLFLLFIYIFIGRWDL